MNLSPPQQQVILDLARSAIRAVLSGGTSPLWPRTADLMHPAGCFVSLHETSGRLRGCVGRLDAHLPLGEAVVTMSQAVLEDPRFLHFPVTLRDLPQLTIEVSILSPLQPAATPTDFDLLNDGIYLTCGGRTGCFLPQVARETGWTKEQLLDRLCTEKLGMPAATWRDPDSSLEKFTVQQIGPEPFNKPAQ